MVSLIRGRFRGDFCPLSTLLRGSRQLQAWSAVPVRGTTPDEDKWDLHELLLVQFDSHPSVYFSCRRILHVCLCRLRTFQQHIPFFRRTNQVPHIFLHFLHKQHLCVHASGLLFLG